MVVISVPLRLKLASSILFLVIPLVALEIIIATRSPWWKLPYRSMGYWSLAFALICIPLSAWVTAGKRWVYPIVVALAGAWIVASSWVAIRMRYPTLGFFTLFLLGFFSLVLPWLRYEMKRSFFDPCLTWYQGLPKPIPGLKCNLSSGEKTIDLKVSRIDTDGVFVFTPAEGGKVSAVLSALLEKSKLDLVFDFRDRQISCQGRPILTIGKGMGAGIQFIGISPDQKKEIGDFVEVLIGEGYIQG